MKKILGSNEAKHHDCCVVQRKCLGIQCMAWRQHVIPAPAVESKVTAQLPQAQANATLSVSRKERRASFLPQSGAVLQSQPVAAPVEVTDKGYCGMLPN